MIQSAFTCLCKAKKEQRLVFDGGVLGHYILELCSTCYVAQDKKFLIREEKIGARK